MTRTLTDNLRCIYYEARVRWQQASWNTHITVLSVLYATCLSTWVLAFPSVYEYLA